MVITPDEILKIGFAILIGGVLGLERDLSHKSAGFRTIILICIGSTIATIMDSRFNAAGRITANVLTGVGFIGAGSILHDQVRIRGLTTAALVWAAATVGIIIGSGNYLFAGIAGGLILIVMTVFNRLEDLLTQRYDRRSYVITLSRDSDKQDLQDMREKMGSCSLRVFSSQRMKRGDKIYLTINAVGQTTNQERFVDEALKDERVEEIQW
ncbi:MAG TPA: MgtC/SapB family protein [Anaerolineaceae bacterium]|nr:MgtC/SapB family protein [Anaerolineaceae bacterium]